MKKTTLAILILTAHARAWDAAGHMLVCQIAWELSGPETRRTVDAMVAPLENQFNGGRPYHFVTVGCWMDDLRSLPKAQYPWSAWHYVDSEKTEDGRDFKLPPAPNVVWAIGENLKTLRDPKANAGDRAKALGMITHWVGDIHQPLHTTTWNDRGGNGYLIAGVHFSDLMQGQLANLHTFWDKAFRFDAREGMIAELWAGPKVDERPKAPGEGIIGAEARALMQRFSRAALAELAPPGTGANRPLPSTPLAANAEAWARESHLIGCKSAYPAGPHPGNAEVRRLTPEFAHATYEVACRRVVLAGYRLAAVLDELFAVKK